MQINVSHRVLRWFNTIEEVLQKVSFQDELGYHTRLFGIQPKKVTIIRYYEDRESLKANKDHMVLFL